MHPWFAEEHIVRCIHVYDQKLIEVLYFTEVGLDGNFPQLSLFSLIEPDDRVGVFKMVNR